VTSLEWVNYLKGLSYPELLDILGNKVYIADERYLIYIDYMLINYPSMDTQLSSCLLYIKRTLLEHNAGI